MKYNLCCLSACVVDRSECHVSAAAVVRLSVFIDLNLDCTLSCDVTTLTVELQVSSHYIREYSKT